MINQDQDLSGIWVGLHDEVFQGATPVLAGVDAASTYCYLLAAEQRRDADTWGVHLRNAAEQGFNPDYTIADAGQGLRAAQQLTRREPQLAAAQLLHPAPLPGQLIPGPAALLPEPSSLHAQPACQTRW